MRLLELKKSIDFASQNFQYKESNSNGIYYITDVNKVKLGLLELKKVNFLNEKYIKILSPIFDSVGTSISYSDINLYRQITSTLKIISHTIEFLNYWFKLSMPEEEENIVNIKLPEISNFSELEFISKKLEGNFSRVVSEIDGGKVEIKQFDHGSFWIVLAVGVPAAVFLIASIAWSAAVVAKKMNECKITCAEVKKANLQVEAIQQLVDYQKRMINELAMREAESIENKCFPNNDNERSQRIREAIKDTAELLIKGVQIQSALSAPENVSNLFPDYKKLPFIESTTLVSTKKS